MSDFQDGLFDATPDPIPEDDGATITLARYAEQA